MSSYHKNTRGILLGATALIGSLALVATPAGAQERQYNFDLPAQPLDAALQAFAHQAQQQVIFAETEVKGITAPRLSGSYSADQALDVLLAGTGFEVRRTASGVLKIAAASDPQSGSAAGDGADQGTVQALVVTAQKREENIQDVPIAMSAFTQEDLTKSQVAGGPDLMTQVPNFTFTKTNFTGYSIQIRGIGTQAISATTDPAVAVAFNNTPFLRNRFFEQEFYDLERVEVLRGPQGTLYGRNATAGVVNIISAKPKSHFEARLSADVGNFNSTRLEGMINLPLVQDKAALRVAGAWTKRDGYVKNILTGQQTDGRDLWSARVTLGITPTDRFSANLIYEHFSENDDRLRSGKQVCRKDPGPAEINGVPIPQATGGLLDNTVGYFSQGCLPASLYAPESFQTPNGFALPYYGPLAGIGAPIFSRMDPYLHATQSRNLREIETHIVPEYEATNDTVELQIKYDITPSLTLASETGFNHDQIFSFEDYNRFDTAPGVFAPGALHPLTGLPDGSVGPRLDVIDINGVFCDPQLGCTDRLALGDLSTAHSLQFSQELRLSSDFEGPVNFSLGANFLRYSTDEKYYVFGNSLTAFNAGLEGDYTGASWPGDNSGCFTSTASPEIDLKGFVWSNPDVIYGVGENCNYIDPNNIHNLNDQGRNYFLSKNPYNLLSYAAFGEIYWQVTPSLKVTTGLRWTDDKKTAPEIPSWLLAGSSYGTPARKTIRQEWRKPTGRLAVDWKPDLSFTDETLLYASYVRGYKAGGANPPPPVTTAAPVYLNYDAVLRTSLTHPETFRPEFVDAYEVGTKNTLLDGHLTFNLNAFYYDYAGYQISEIVDRSAVNFNFDAKVWGSELEIDWQPLESLRLALKGGYENTRVADGSQAIDLIDRTAGDPNFVLKRPFPTIPSNCIIPIAAALTRNCVDYYITTYTDVPNNGDGVEKSLSGNALPNAPKFTTTITADYTVPLPNNWLMTLHTDLYYQSEAWTRIFNDPGYDKLKAYNNVNLAAIFSNEDAGWQVMAYIKNVFDRDNITGAFLNSDDTGLTTNVFLNEPRLFGLRVTKNWSGSDWWTAHANKSGYYPFRVEFDGDYGHFTNPHEVLAPYTTSLFPAAHPYPLGVQNALDWGAAGGVKFTYRPHPNGWFASAAVRYGRAMGSAEGHPKWDLPHGGFVWGDFSIPLWADAFGVPLDVAESILGSRYVDPTSNGWYNYATTTGSSSESHAFADFVVGRDAGLGRDMPSSVNVGLRYAHLKSSSSDVLHGRPDFYLPAQDIITYGGHLHRLHAKMDTSREFEGAGPEMNWDTSLHLLGEKERSGAVDLDMGVGGVVLWGKQATTVRGQLTEEYVTGVRQFTNPAQGKYGEHVATTLTPLGAVRSKRVTVPGVNANLGLTYTVGGVKVSGGYRVERYFDAIDGGILTRQTYDRQYDGPYFKVSIGFGG